MAGACSVAREKADTRKKAKSFARERCRTSDAKRCVFPYDDAMAENGRLAKAMARLDALTDWERRPRGTMRVDLAPMLDLAARLGDPQKAFRSIHVAGTKGKGSVSALIEAALARAGFASDAMLRRMSSA